MLSKVGQRIPIAYLDTQGKEQALMTSNTILAHLLMDEPKKWRIPTGNSSSSSTSTNLAIGDHHLAMLKRTSPAKPHLHLTDHTELTSDMVNTLNSDWLINTNMPFFCDPDEGNLGPLDTLRGTIWSNKVGRSPFRTTTKRRAIIVS